MSEARVRELELELVRLRKLVHTSTEELVAEAEARCEKRLKRVRKRLLLASHPDKTISKSSKEISESFNRIVREVCNI